MSSHDTSPPPPPDPTPDPTPVTVFGTAGDDTLVGGPGNDFLFGGGGNDTLSGGDGNDVIDGGAGADSIDGGAGDDSLSGGDGNDVIDGRAGADSIDGGAGDDILYGGAGADTIRGGPGNDVYYVDDATDVVIDVPNTGLVASTLAYAVALTALEGITDTVIAAVNYSLANVAFVENLTLDSSGAATTATGNELDNVLTGNALNNTLSGLAGDDTLSGGAGNDTLDGGAGIDTAVFSGNRAAPTITRTASGYTVSGPDGSDTLSNLERLQFSDKKVALDLGPGAAAGNTVRIIGAAFDAPTIEQRPNYVGIGLQLFDDGMSLLQVCAFALGSPLYLSLAGSASNVDFVNTVYRNVVGVLPSATERGYYVGLLQGSGGSMTQAQLLEIAANADLNAVNINLVGLQQSGVEFV